MLLHEQIALCSCSTGLYSFVYPEKEIVWNAPQFAILRVIKLHYRARFSQNGGWEPKVLTPEVLKHKILQRAKISRQTNLKSLSSP